MELDEYIVHVWVDDLLLFQFVVFYLMYTDKWCVQMQSKTYSNCDQLRLTTLNILKKEKIESIVL